MLGEATLSPMRGPESIGHTLCAIDRHVKTRYNPYIHPHPIGDRKYAPVLRSVILPANNPPLLPGVAKQGGLFAKSLRISQKCCKTRGLFAKAVIC